MLELTVKEKERIGKLFKYYRKKNKIHWKEIEKMCSTSTYSNIEKGKIYKNSTLYDDLFDLFEIQYESKYNFNNWLKEFLLKFKDILEWYKEEEFDSLINELENELGPYKNSIIYQQYYQIITYILNYYKYSKYMKLEEIEDCFNLFECFDFEETIMVFLLETMFISNNNSINNNELIKKTYVESLKHKDSPILWYIQAFYYKTQAMFESSLELFNQTYMLFYNQKNKYRTSKALMGKFIIYKNIDSRKAEEIVELFMRLKQENKLYKTMLPNINFNIGMYYYLNNKYEKALQLFMENINEYQTKREWYYVCAICTQLNLSIPKEFENYNVQDNEDPIIMEYFHMKYNKNSSKKLVNYIMKVIVPQCLIGEKYKQPYWTVFEEELFYFSKKDKRFTDTFLEFLDLEKKACKKC